jgi:hypothetical protein
MNIHPEIVRCAAGLPSGTSTGYAATWYRIGIVTTVAMTLRFTDAETQALRAQAAAEHRSMQDVARRAIVEYIERRRRERQVDAAVDRVRERDVELLRLLAE